jgi:signal transduction histidine kinase
MKLYENLLDQLRIIFGRIDSQMELISYIDHAILLPQNEAVDEVIGRICDRVKDIVGASGVAVLIPVQRNFLPMCSQGNSVEFDRILNDRIDDLNALKSEEHLVIDNDLSDRPKTMICLPIATEDGIFGFLSLIYYNNRPDQDLQMEILPYLKMLTTQLGIMISRFLNQRMSELTSGLVNVFFDSKLKPSKCWQEIVRHISYFLPNWQPFRLSPEPKVQLLSYSEGDRHLRIIGTQGGEMLGTEVLIDSSICGMLIEDRSQPYVCVNPQDYLGRYKGFLLDDSKAVPQSELAVSIRLNDSIIGVINLEHPQPNVFHYQHVQAVLAAASFLGPFLAALRERYERQRNKEIGILYTMNHLLTRLASTYQHLLGQPLLDMRLTMEELEKEISSKSSTGLTMLQEIRTQVDKIHLSSDRFCEALPHFLKYGSVNVKNAIKLALSVFNLKRLEQEENITVTQWIAEDVGWVYASELLQEHIYNLINNSLYAVRKALARGTIDKGEIVIEAKKLSVKDMLDQPTASQLVTFKINDNGTGTPKEQEASIGDPGFTIKEDYGTGYGLSSAMEYVQSVGGCLKWHNYPEKGFSVDFVLEEFDEEKHKERGEKND